MKSSTKAALVSALVFPGTGHWLLKRAGRGCLFLLPSALSAYYLCSQVLQRANAIADQVLNGSLPLDPQLIADRIAADPGAEGPMMTVAVTVALICWAGAIIDALWIGKQTGR